MMRVPVLMALLLAPLAALAAPVPPPPGNFTGVQYIDGKGCVFQRVEGGWQARTGSAGEPLCGFPPSIEMRRLDPDSSHVLLMGPPEPPADPAALLAERLAEELRQADLAEPTPVVAPTPAAPSPLSEQIAASLAVQQRAAQGFGVQSDLCRRLGYGDDPVEGGVPDPTGFCPGSRSPAPGAVLGDMTPASRQVASPADPAPPRPAAAAATHARAPEASAGQAGGAPTRRAAAPVAGVEMIPAHARYVQIGAFRPDDADRAIRALAAKRLPAVRLRADPDQPMVIMAGPFDDRRTLIEVLNRLRSEGWPGAVAR
ncbi:SPOR domain-containing protein [Paracoccus sp. NSM]|uniref:SPOR domain-containing protein n=1 Tax=Paracoccus sp. NSM TaxID=3457784 RepID=UPI004036892E